MLDTVLNKAGQSAGDAVGAGVAGGYIGFMLGPWAFAAARCHPRESGDLSGLWRHSRFGGIFGRSPLSRG